jgi:cobalamin biosynthesis protein CbiG
VSTRVVVGVGLTGSATGDDVEQAVTTALSACGRRWTDVAALATSDARRSHPAVVAVAGRRGVRLAAHHPEALARVAVPNPSASVEDRTGSPSVAEAAALLTARALAAGRPTLPRGIVDILDPKRCTDRVCTAVAAVSPPAT